MKGSDLVVTLPETSGEIRESLIIQAVKDGHYVPLQWSAIRSVVGPHFAILYVLSDAFKLGEPSNYFRINVSHTGAQRIADILGLALPTTKISDLIHEQAAVIIKPCIQVPDAQMAHTHRMIRHSMYVTDYIMGREGLVSTVGKDWVLTNSLMTNPSKGANYGWHSRSGGFRSPGALKLLQPLGLVHNRHHVDYSQVLRLVHRRILVDGNDMLLEDVMQDQELSGLVSYEGVLRSTRHPGVALEGELQPPPPWGVSDV